MVKKNLRSFAGFEFAKDSSEYNKKLEAIKKVDNKGLRSICEILVLDRKGSKNEIVLRVLKFLMEPDESLCLEQGDEDEEDAEEEDPEEDEDEEDPPSEEDKKRKSTKSSGPAGRGSARNSAGRPRRSTAGKSKLSSVIIFSLKTNLIWILFAEMSAYVDFSSSEESEHKVAVAKRRRNDDSESGSDVRRVWFYIPGKY